MTWMTIWRCEYPFDNDSESRREQFLGSDSKSSFDWDWDDFPVDVLFSTLVTLAPFDVTLTVTIARPVLDLAIFGAVSPFLAPTAQFGRRSTKFETVGAVHETISFLLKV